jgi:Tfp pilus assembly protein PilF
MNRKQRRAMRVQGTGVGVEAGRTQPSAQASVTRLFAQAVWHQHHGKPNEAVRLYKQVLELEPDHAEASNNLGCLLLAQGKRAAASACFERALMLLPQLFDYYPRTAASIGLKGRILLKNAF